MAKISAAQREQNKQQFDLVVEEIFWELGFEAVTLNEVARRAGKTKATIQNYYPTKKHFGEALRGKPFQVVIEALDFSSPETFITTWEVAMKSNRKFRMVIHLLVSNSTSENMSDITLGGLIRLRNHLESQWDSELVARNTMLHVLGLSVMLFAEEMR
ncbi:TetR family transcriptional regulator [Vibrio harveyi]|nr:TetR family transcriptional regulator [Vibrio harveyi]